MVDSVGERIAMKPVAPLFQHQEKVINAAMECKYNAIFLRCGRGKSRIAIELIQRQSAKALIISPNTALENWGDEIKLWSNLTYIILQGTRSKRLKLLKEPADIYVINYEALRILEQELIAMGFTYIIADELQKIKGHRTLQSKAAFRIAQRIPCRIGLTGTPIINNYCDIFGEYRFLNPYIFGFSFYRWRARYCILGGYMNKEITSYINIDELQDKINSIAIRVDDDGLKLPPRLYQKHYVDLLPEQKRVYSELRKEFISQIQGKTVTAPYILTRLLRLSQCTAGFCKTEDQQEINFDSNPKLKWLREFIEDLPNNEKVVIFFRFIKELKNLQAMFKEMNIPFVEVYGDIKDRQEKINEFNNTDTRIFLGQLQTAGLSINLKSAYCVFLTNSYSFGDREQCEGRTHGIGRGKEGYSTLYLDCIARGTIDETILECLKTKKDLATRIVEEINGKE